MWDLELLLRTTIADLGAATPAFAKTIDVAVDRVMGLSFDVYKAQVVPYLAADHQEVYGTRQTWARICELVLDRLTEARR